MRGEREAVPTGPERKVGAAGGRGRGPRQSSQDLEAPGGLVFVVEAVRGVEVKLPGGGGGGGRLFVVQTVGGVEGQPGAAVARLVVMVMVMMVVVAGALAQRVVAVGMGAR